MSFSVVVGSVGSVGVERVVAALQSELCEEALAYIVQKGKGKSVMEQRRFCWHWEGKGREGNGRSEFLFIGQGRRQERWDTPIPRK